MNILAVGAGVAGLFIGAGAVGATWYAQRADPASDRIVDIVFACSLPILERPDPSKPFDPRTNPNSIVGYHDLTGEEECPRNQARTRQTLVIKSPEGNGYSVTVDREEHHEIGDRWP